VNVYSYARISTDMQSEASIPDQFTYCREFAATNGWTIAAEFSDVGISGASFLNRPGIQAALKALQTGDLSGAQSAFDALTALGQTGPNKNGQTFSRADREQDFQAIGQALQSGDLAGAQSAFANLSATFGKQDQQSQTAISAYNSSVTGIITNRIPPPTSTGGLGTETTRFIGPPILEQPPTPPPSPIGPPVVQPPTEPPRFLGPPSAESA